MQILLASYSNVDFRIVTGSRISPRFDVRVHACHTATKINHNLQLTISNWISLTAARILPQGVFIVSKNTLFAA